MLYTTPFDEQHPKYYRRIHETLHGKFNTIEIGFNRVPAGYKQIMKRNIFAIHYVTAGKGVFQGKPFSKGDCYFVVPDELETIEAAKDASYECLWVMLRGRKAREILAECDFPEHNCVFKFEDSATCGEIIKEYLFSNAYENAYVEACKLEEVFYKVLALHFKACPQSLKQREKAHGIAEFLEENYNNNIKIRDLCDIFHLSQNHLCTVFKKKHGMTPREYLIAYRLEKAKQFLKESDEKTSIAEISFSVGIENPLYFSRCFRKRFGMSPTEFRKG